MRSGGSPTRRSCGCREGKETAAPVAQRQTARFGWCGLGSPISHRRGRGVLTPWAPPAPQKHLSGAACTLPGPHPARARPPAHRQFFGGDFSRQSPPRPSISLLGARLSVYWNEPAGSEVIFRLVLGEHRWREIIPGALSQRRCRGAAGSQRYS